MPVEREGYRYIPGQFQYSGGVAAAPGYAIERVRFANPVPPDRRLPPHACELRSPGRFTDAGFVAERWGPVANDRNPIARSNVCPQIDPPATPSFHAFCYVTRAPNAPPSFVCAGSGDAQESTAPVSRQNHPLRRDHAGREGQESALRPRSDGIAYGRTRRCVIAEA